jgi:hypothetical protein
VAADLIEDPTRLVRAFDADVRRFGGFGPAALTYGQAANARRPKVPRDPAHWVTSPIS